MYLSGSKWNMRRRRRRTNPLRVLVLLSLIAAAIYFERVIVPTVPPLFVPTPVPTRSSASFALEAVSSFEAGRLAQAEEAFREAIAANPREQAYHVDLARVLVYAGRYQEAETSASNSVLLDPSSPIANAVHAWTLDFLAGQEPDAARRVEMLQDALTQIEQAVALNPSSALTQAYHAEILMDNDVANYARALEAARKAVQLEPTLMESHRALGYVWEATGSYAQAVDSYQAALRINPNLPLLHMALGNMYQAQEEFDPAIESYLRAVGLAPTDPEPLRRIAQVYFRLGEYGPASQYAADAVEKDPANPYRYGDLGRIYYKNEEYDKAVDALRIAIEGGAAQSGAQVRGLPLDPGDAKVVEFYYTYGLALARNGECELARRVFEALLVGVPDNETAIFNAQEGLVICGLAPATSTPAATPGPTP